MLTAESEGGQIKSHPYWHTDSYGPLHVKLLSEKRIPLDQSRPPPVVATSSLKRPSLGQRRSTNPHTAFEKQYAKESGKSAPSEPLVLIQRHFTVLHSGLPFQPMREITQIQYAHWPDFGAPASPGHLLNLIDHTNKAIRGTGTPNTTNPGTQDPAPESQRPIVVHCSAGCGRTGTFCTVDSVLDMLRRQRAARAGKPSPVWRHGKSAKERDPDAMDVDGPEFTGKDMDSDWEFRDDLDLVERAVTEFRSQRLSMVQSLRQFVLCYESVLEWLLDWAPSISGIPQRPTLAGGMKEGSRHGRTAGGRFSYSGNLSYGAS